MPFELNLGYTPGGYAASSGRDGEIASVIVKEFTSSEDGDIFIDRLEGLPDTLLQMLPPEARATASQVDHLLAIIQRDQTAVVYVNELKMMIEGRPKRAFNKGEAVRRDDIAEVKRLYFESVSLPPDAGILFLFSRDWRKGLFYDFAPLSAECPPREYNLELLLGQYYSYLGHQHIFKMSPDEWGRLLEQQWFPFTSLKINTVKEILEYLRNTWPVDDLLNKITEEVRSMCNGLLDRWNTSPIIQSHYPLIEHAVRRYQESDYISSTSILVPRIEGIMRSHFIGSKGQSKSTQTQLIDAVVGTREEVAFNLLLPARFREYLKTVYFAAFQPGQPPPLSRNSVAHGVARAEDFSEKSATVGLLTLDQIFFYLPGVKNHQ